MTCFKCKGNMVESTTTDVTDTGNYLIIIRNVPCYKCTKCDEIYYDGTTIKNLEKITALVKSISNEITIIDYKKVA